MSIQPTLFTTEKKDSMTKRPERWLFVTNHLNLLYMLAAGLIMSPKGFGEKYFADSLAIYPGWIPLFPDSVPLSAIQQSLSEAKHLKPCLLSINLSSVIGQVKSINVDNSVKDIWFPTGIEGTERILLIPAPLPITSIDSIIFRSRDEKTDVGSDASDYSNVPFKKFKSEIKKQFFTDKGETSWPVDGVVLPNRDLPMDVPFAAGAMMAMMLRMANIDNLGKEACKIAFDPGNEIPREFVDPMISTVGEWQRKGRLPDNTSDVLKKLFWGAIDSLIDCRVSQCRESDFDVILGYLQSVSTQFEDKLKEPLLKLSEDLRELASFGDSTITELFERHPKSFSRVMTLFFLREKCTDLLEFTHPLLKEKDYLAAALLFAARDGWLNMPMELRGCPGLQEAVSHRMAVMAHRISGTDIDLGTPPPRPKPLIELFEPRPQGWDKNQKEAALFLARDCKWDCIRTRITLGKGEYRMEVDGKGTHIFMDGEAKAVATEVDKDQFFSNLMTQRFSSKQEQKARVLLKV